MTQPSGGLIWQVSTASVEQASISLPSHAAAASMTLGVTHIMNRAKRVAQAPRMTSGGRMRRTAPKVCRVWTGNALMMSLFISKTFTCSSRTCKQPPRKSAGEATAQGSTTYTSTSECKHFCRQWSINTCLHAKKEATSWPVHSGWGAHLLGALCPEELLLTVHCSLVLLFHGVHRLLQPHHLVSDSVALPGLV